MIIVACEVCRVLLHRSPQLGTSENGMLSAAVVRPLEWPRSTLRHEEFHPPRPPDWAREIRRWEAQPHCEDSTLDLET